MRFNVVLGIRHFLQYIRKNTSIRILVFEWTHFQWKHCLEEELLAGSAACVQAVTWACSCQYLSSVLDSECKNRSGEMWEFTPHYMSTLWFFVTLTCHGCHEDPVHLQNDCIFISLFRLTSTKNLSFVFLTLIREIHRWVVYHTKG